MTFAEASVFLDAFLRIDWIQAAAGGLVKHSREVCCR